MEKNKKSLYKNTIIIKDKDIIIKMKKDLEDALLEIAFRLTDLVIYSNFVRRKNELILLLDKLNKIGVDINEDYHQQEAKKEDFNNYIFALGKAHILKLIINSLINKLEDIEKENKLTEEDKKIIEESKKYERLEYLG